MGPDAMVLVFWMLSFKPAFSLSHFPFFLCLLRLFFAQLFVSPPQTTIFPFFFLQMILITASCTMARTSVHISSGTVSDQIPWICLSFPLYNHKGFDLGHKLYGLVVFSTFFNLNLQCAVRSSWSEPQSGPSLVFADCIELLHLRLQGV